MPRFGGEYRVSSCPEKPHRQADSGRESALDSALPPQTNKITIIVWGLWACSHTIAHTWRSEGNFVGQFCPSTVWFPELKSGLQFYVASTLPAEAPHQLPTTFSLTFEAESCVTKDELYILNNYNARLGAA